MRVYRSFDVCAPVELTLALLRRVGQGGNAPFPAPLDAAAGWDVAHHHRHLRVDAAVLHGGVQRAQVATAAGDKHGHLSLGLRVARGARGDPSRAGGARALRPRRQRIERAAVGDAGARKRRHRRGRHPRRRHESTSGVATIQTRRCAERHSTRARRRRNRGAVRSAGLTWRKGRGPTSDSLMTLRFLSAHIQNSTARPRTPPPAP